MIEALGSALDMFFTPGVLLAFFLIIPYALLDGLLPLAGLPLTILLFGFVGILDPTVALVLIIAKGAQGDITEPIPAILMGIPGARAAQATVLDGHPLAKQGRAGYALGASYGTTLVGGVFGAVVVFAMLPLMRELLRNFGSPEFFLFTVMAVFSVGILSTGAMVKGLLSGILGLSIAFVGFSNVAGEARATFGTQYLFDGFSIIPVIVGLFAIPEAISLIVSNRAVALEHAEEVLKGKASQRQAIEGMRETFRHKWLVIRSSLVGVLFGILPGVGATAAHWITYTQARMTERGALNTFGKGDIRGVLAADAPNNSSDAGDLIPVLLFGIPAGGGSALLLALMVLMGFVPGPAMVNEHLDVTILLLIVIALSNIVVVPIMFMFAGTIAKFTAIPANVVAPFIIVLTLLSAFMGTQNLLDLVTVLGFAALGLFMKAYGWPRPPILIAVVLSQLLEKYAWLSIASFGWRLFARPQFLMVLVILIVVFVAVWNLQRKSAAAARAASALSDAPEIGSKVSDDIAE